MRNSVKRRFNNYLIKKNAFIGSAVSSGLHLLVLGAFAGGLGYFIFGEMPVKKESEHLIAQLNYEPVEVELAFEEYEMPEIEIKQEYLSVPEYSITVALEEIVGVMELAEKEQRELEKKVRDLEIDKMGDEELVKGLEERVEKVARYPKEHVDEINRKIRSRKEIGERKYHPVSEVDFLTSINSAVPYYRLVKRDGQTYFQHLVINEFGDYIIEKEILQSKMTFEDKKNLRIYQITEPIKDIRNTALSIIVKMLD